MIPLRDYQSSIVATVRERIRAGSKSVLIQAPTGSGKTCLAAHILAGAAGKGKRAWFLVHRRELLRQAEDTFALCGIDSGIVSASRTPDKSKAIQICSVQSLRRRMASLPKPDLIVVDEAHHQGAATYKAIHAGNPQAVYLGLSATPVRLDGAGLGAWFADLIEGPPMADLIGQGWLAPYRLFAPGAVQLEGVHTVAGDYNKHELAGAMAASAVVGDAVREYRRLAAGRRALLFAWSIEASKQLASEFAEAGIPAEHVDGETHSLERDMAIARFRSGETLVIANVDLFGEGFDAPGAEAALLLRPTQSLGIYLQQVGRVMRPGTGKTAIIIDHAGNCLRHGMPDDPRIWTLSQEKPSKAKGEGPFCRMCPQCFAAASMAARACPECGTAFIIHGREVERIEGDLEETSADALKRLRGLEAWRAQSLEDLRAIGRAMGYKPGWAWFKWQARAKRYAGRNQEEEA